MKISGLPCFSLALLAAASSLVTGPATAKPWWLRGVESNDQDYLPPDVAFRVGAQVDGGEVRVRWIIADGYYLYRSKIEILAESPDSVLGTPEFPPGIRVDDPNFGRQEVYRQQVEVGASVTRSDFGAHPLQVKVKYQGCADRGLCYPVMSKVLFPQSSAAAATATGPGPARSGSWAAVTIVAGSLAFFLAGFVLRKKRRLPTPAP